jgi:hypothetical protein
VGGGGQGLQLAVAAQGVITMAALVMWLADSSTHGCSRIADTHGLRDTCAPQHSSNKHNTSHRQRPTHLLCKDVDPLVPVPCRGHHILEPVKGAPVHHNHLGLPPAGVLRPPGSPGGVTAVHAGLYHCRLETKPRLKVATLSSIG